MNILAILTSTVMYGKERSNIEVYNLLQSKLGCKFHIVANQRTNEAIKNVLANFSSSYINCPNRRSKRFRLLTFVLTYIAANVRVLWIIKKTHPDLIMMNSEIDFYNFYLSLLFYKGKIIYRIGDAPAFPKLSFRRYNQYVWRNFIIKRSSVMVFISRYIRDCVATTGRDTSNDSIIYNYPPTRRASDETDNTKYKKVLSSELSFGYLGQVIEIKGVHHFIESALRILESGEHATFYVAGSLHYDSNYAQKVINLVPNQWKHSIVFLDEISDIETFFSHIDVLCVPSIKQEPLGNVIVEAKKHSKPCIVYPSGGMPELISDSVDGFVCKSADVDSLYECMTKYVNNKSLAEKHGRASIASVEKLGIGKEMFEAKWMEVINKLFKRGE